MPIRFYLGEVFNMSLVLSITFHFHYIIWGCMCSTGPFQFRWLKGYINSSCYYHHQIGSINLTHCYHIFPWLCVWDVCNIIFLLHIHSGKTGILFSLLLCSLWWVQIVGCVLACRSYSFVYSIISLSSLCKRIWRHWTYKMPVRIILLSVCEIKHIISVIHYTRYGAVCFQFTHLPCDNWEHMYFVLLPSSNRKYELLSIV